MKMQSDARISVSFMSSIQEVLDFRVFFSQRLIYSIKPCFSSLFSLVFTGSRMLLSAQGFAGLVGWGDVSSKAYVRLIAGDGCGGEGVISDRNV